LFFIALSLLVLVTPSINNFVNALEYEDDRTIIFDDWFSNFINTWSWGLQNDIDNKFTGDTAQLILVPSGSQYQNIEYRFYEDIDLSIWSNWWFWFYGNGSGETIQFRFMNNATDGYYVTFNDNWVGWNYYGFIDFQAIATQIASNADWSCMDRFLMVMSSNPASEFTIRLDYMFFSNGSDIMPSTPTPSPTPTPDLILSFEEIFFGEYAYIGMVIFMILGLIAMYLTQYAGIFVFILSMLYEFELYARLDIYGNNVWYMIIIIVYAVFSAYTVFEGLRGK